MSDDATLFDGVTNTDVVEKTTETPSGNELKVPTELLEFIGEGRKYKTPEEALKSIPHAQVHIAKLEEERKALEEELQKRKTAEELIEEFRATGSNKPNGEATPQSTLDPKELAKLVEVTLEHREATKMAQANAKAVIDTFMEKFGDVAKAKEHFVKLAQENGLSVDTLNKLAETSPNAVFKLAGFDKTVNQGIGKPSSTLNTEALGNQPKQVDTSAIRVKPGASSRDVVNAWRAAGEAVKKEMGV